jgi:hypothetical protein
MTARKLILALFTVSTSVWAQGNLGGLTGTVTDNTNASVPDAKLTLTSEQTNEVYTVNADSAGVFTFRGVQPGTYRLEIEAQGFKKSIQEHVRVLTATISNLDVSLALGAVSESVTVTTAAVTLQTTTPEISTVLDRRSILDLPIQVGGSGATTAASGRRQPENFIFLTPGCERHSVVQEHQWQSGLQPGGAVRRHLRSARRNTGLSGADFPALRGGRRVQSAELAFPREYGRGFGVINFTLRSGTNQFHGGLFEFFRNDKLDARPFFNAVRPRVRFNEYGGSFGGPIIIPSSTTGRTRLFSTSTTPDCGISGAEWRINQSANRSVQAG